jgi:hypothetical protein
LKVGTTIESSGADRKASFGDGAVGVARIALADIAGTPLTLVENGEDSPANLHAAAPVQRFHVGDVTIWPILFQSIDIAV